MPPYIARMQAFEDGSHKNRDTVHALAGGGARLVNTVTFDTLKLLETLEATQIPREHVRASRDNADTASQADIAALASKFIALEDKARREAEQTATKGDIALVRKDIEIIRRDMEIVRRDLTIRIGAMLMLGFGTGIGVLIKLLG